MGVGLAVWLRRVLCLGIFVGGAGFEKAAETGSWSMIFSAVGAMVCYCILFVEFIPQKEEDD